MHLRMRAVSLRGPVLLRAELCQAQVAKPIVARTCVGRLFLSREALIKVLVSPVVPPPGGTLLLIVPCL
jgi:hypothetical protein